MNKKRGKNQEKQKRYQKSDVYKKCSVSFNGRAAPCRVSTAMSRRGIRKRAKQIFNKQYPGQKFYFSDGWFAGLKKRYKISLRRATNSCQKPPESKKEAIRHFHDLERFL